MDSVNVEQQQQRDTEEGNVQEQTGTKKEVSPDYIIARSILS